MEMSPSEGAGVEQGYGFFYLSRRCKIIAQSTIIDHRLKIEDWSKGVRECLIWPFKLTQRVVEYGKGGEQQDETSADEITTVFYMSRHGPPSACRYRPFIPEPRHRPIIRVHISTLPHPHIPLQPEVASKRIPSFKAAIRSAQRLILEHREAMLHMEAWPHVCVAVQERCVSLEREVHEPQAMRLVPLRDDHPARDVRRAHVDDPVVRWGRGGVEPLEVREGRLAAAFEMA